nr:hypothetical protein [Tanacetum cinerariifolium]
MVGFKMYYFKGMSYDDIRPIYEKYCNSNVAFLEKSKEQLEEEESRALKRQRESLEEKAAKKQKLDEEVEELKKHLQIVPNDDDDVYTEATPLALKVPVVDYEIYSENNKPFYKIIRADGSHQLFLSFLCLIRNFDREDMEISSLEESKKCSWFSKIQKLEIVRVLWSAYHNIYNYIDDLAGREKKSIDKVHFGSDDEQCKMTLKDFLYFPRNRSASFSARPVDVPMSVGSPAGSSANVPDEELEMVGTLVANNAVGAKGKRVTFPNSVGSPSFKKRKHVVLDEGHSSPKFVPDIAPFDEACKILFGSLASRKDPRFSDPFLLGIKEARSSCDALCNLSYPDEKVMLVGRSQALKEVASSGKLMPLKPQIISFENASTAGPSASLFL